jgi:hypothetical protein
MGRILRAPAFTLENDKVPDVTVELTGGRIIIRQHTQNITIASEDAHAFADALTELE